MRKVQGWRPLYCKKDLFMGRVVEPFLPNKVDEIIVLHDIVFGEIPLIDLPL